MACACRTARRRARPSAASLLGVAGAVQVDVVDVAASRPAAASACCIAMRAPTPFGMRRRHVIGIARLADAEQQDRVRHRRVPQAAPAARTPPPRRSRCRCARIERPAGRCDEQLQRVEAVQRRQAQRIDAADHGRVDEAGFDHAPRRAEHLGARRTGGRHRHRRPVQPEIRAHEAGERKRCCAWCA